MVAIVSIVYKVMASNGANPIVRHQAHKRRGQNGDIRLTQWTGDRAREGHSTRTSLVVS